MVAGYVSDRPYGRPWTVTAWYFRRSASPSRPRADRYAPAGEAGRTTGDSLPFVNGSLFDGTMSMALRKKAANFAGLTDQP